MTTLHGERLRDKIITAGYKAGINDENGEEQGFLYALADFIECLVAANEATMTETILHGHQIALLSRLSGAHEIIITTPSGVHERYNGHDLDRRIKQRERELKVLRVAREILLDNSQPLVAEGSEDATP